MEDTKRVVAVGCRESCSRYIDFHGQDRSDGEAAVCLTLIPGNFEKIPFAWIVLKWLCIRKYSL